MLPGRDGFDLLDVVRNRTDAGIVMVTARDALDDRLRGLDSGADDYVVKPFLLEELTSRVRAVLRRRGRTPTALVVGDLVIDEVRVVGVVAPHHLSALRRKLEAHGPRIVHTSRGLGYTLRPAGEDE